MKIRVVSLSVIIFSIVLNLAAQEKEQTIEQLYLQSAIKTQIIKAEAVSLDRDLKKIALEGIEEMIKEGSAADNPDIVEILGSLSGEGVTTIIREEGLVVNDYPEIRREAARLLGQLGTQEAADKLQTILLTDPEPMVMSEAVLAISLISVTDTASRDRALSESIYRQTAVKKDNNFAIAYIEAVEKIIAREKSIGSLTIIEEVTKIADARQGYLTKVQQRALQLLRDLKDF
ncbi:MAG: hypothetical protein B0D92_07650 [Spirochaeta sp. LUC14_002_19_P3]|nr:MAG: hypothetical protein B0D92_07650 [Spirochaeta sp. LUC14_002_19_P3]